MKGAKLGPSIVQPVNIPIAVPRWSSLYMSAMTPDPTDDPLDAPAAWMKRQINSSGTEVAWPTPNEPAQKMGREMR